MSSRKAAEFPSAIDTHVHLWRYVAAEHPWMTAAMTSLRQDFLLEQLQPTLRDAGIESAIAVQAQSSLHETRWLLELAETHRALAGVVGWVPLCAEDLPAILEQLANHSKLLGVRHVGVDDPDDELLLRDDFNRGITRLSVHRLPYDIIVLEHQLPQALQLVDKHPNQIFILDHLGRPKIAGAPSLRWRTYIPLLARRPNLYCKLSSLTTGADWQRWTIDDLRPYFDSALAAFGPQRLMFGSDWPMCLLSCDYRRWIQAVLALIASLSSDEQQWIWRRTAEQVYGSRLSTA